MQRSEVQASYPGPIRQLAGLGAMALVLLLCEAYAFRTGTAPLLGLGALVTVVFVTMWSGLRTGLLSCAMLVAYIFAIHTFSFSNLDVRPGRRNADVISTAILFPMISIFVGILHGKLRKSRWEAAKALEAREAEGEIRRSRERELTASEEFNALIVGASMDAIIVADEMGRITSWNRHAEELFEWTSDEVIGKTLSETIIPESFRSQHESGLARYRETGGGPVFGTRLELVAQKRSGGQFPVEITIASQRLDDTTRFVGFIRDITARKQTERELRDLNVSLESRVAERTAELQAANRDLESFCYSAAHDLRSPLRSINGFSHELLNFHSANLDEDGQDCAKRIHLASSRMSKLVEDLLQFSKSSAVEINNSIIPVSMIAESIALELRERDSTRNVEFRIEPELQVNGDIGLIRIALGNLLDNAWKYSAKNTTPVVIEVGETQVSGERVFYVRDNGAGFDMAQVDDLFEPFRRLHVGSEYPGSGIGLATVQRIVERHGGKIWAESEVGQGATFYLQL